MTAATCYPRPAVDSRGVSWLLFGCGYTATRLARPLLGEGARVIATRRTAGGAAATAAALGPAAQVRVANLLAPASLAALVPPGAVVVHSAPPAGDDGAPAAEEALVRAAADAGARRMIY